MKIHVTLVVAALTFGLLFLGCSKKREAVDDLQEPMTMTSLTDMAAEPQVRIAPVPADTREQEPAAASSLETQNTPPSLEPLPPSGPYKPAITDIQTALKNAGLYSGAVDGKSGPLTKKAIEEFQKANNLKVDGKVGPQTWGLLSQQLAPVTPVAPPAKKKR